MDGRTGEGEAYAVLTDAGELVFFRSEEKYEDWEIAHARDVLGNEYEGRVFAGIETKRRDGATAPGWCAKTVASVRIADSQAITPVSCAHWFNGQADMIDCNLEGLNTSKVTNMDSMFRGCKSLATPPDTSKWDTSRVEYMSGMFLNCESLKTPPDTSGWDTSRVEYMDNMFVGCESLVTPPDTSKWDTSRVMNMGLMFAGCLSLKTPPDVSRWDTSNLLVYDNMFDGCDNLEWVPDIGSQVKEEHNR